MIVTLSAMVAGFAAGASAVPDGSKLRPGDSCYVTTVDGKPNATILRRVERASSAPDAPWTITLNSQFAKMRIDARLTLAYADLRPIDLTESDAVTRYSGKRVVTTGGEAPVDRELPQPIWEQLGLELVVTALPLADGAHFELPTYGGGEPGSTVFDVSGSVMVDTPVGKIEAWRVVKRSAGDMPLTYLVAKNDRRLLGIDVDTVRSRLGGDCSELGK